MKKTYYFLLMSLQISSCAYATTQNLTATGTVSTTCSFGAVQQGTLGVNPGFARKLNTLQASGGSPVTFNISYFGTPTLSVAPPTSFDQMPAAASTMNPSFNIEMYSTAQGQATPDGSGNVAFTYASGDSDSLTLDMQAQFPNNNVPLGTYALTAVATCQ